MSGVGCIGAKFSEQQTNMTSMLSTQLEAQEQAKVRENMVRQFTKKKAQLEQDQRVEEMKTNMKIGEGWMRALG
ncbi:MAG: hypothetical protein HYU64_16805 [Armatimonadetes bacterium]|nr:hypothetical protein [Armatimonadota bacterium]